MISYRHEYFDRDITFYLQLYKDYVDACHCLATVRRYYPASRVIVISDGDDDRRYRWLSWLFRTEYSLGERLYTLENGGKMIQRMLDAFLENPSAYLVKIDTDTRVHRRFRHLPEGRMLFGTIEWETAGRGTRLEFPNLQGGCIGFTQEAAREIADSGLLLSNALIDYRKTYADNPDIIMRAEKSGLVSMDFIVRYVCRQLCIPLVSFDEVYSIWRGDISSDGAGYAMTHPHKRKGRNLNLREHYIRDFPHLTLRRIMQYFCRWDREDSADDLTAPGPS